MHDCFCNGSNMVILRKTFLAFFVFFYIFNPTNFTSFNFYFILIIASLFYCIFYSKDFKKIFLSKSYVYFILFHLYLVSYIVLINYLTGGNSIYRIYVIALLLSLLPSAFLIVREFSILYKLNIDSFMGFFIKIVCLQLLFVILSILYPELRILILSTSRDPELLEVSSMAALRSFGLANGYTSTFPMFMGVFALFVMHYFAVEKKTFNSLFYLTVFILLTVTIILNARIGLLPIVLILIYLLLTLSLKKISMKFFLISGIAFLAFNLATKIEIDAYVERTMWAVEEIYFLMGGDLTGTFYVLSHMLVLPDSYSSFLLGSGSDVFGDNSPYSFSSDIGLIKDVHIFGMINLMVYSFILFVFFRKLMHEIMLKFGIHFAVILVISFLAYYFKGSIFAASETINFLIILSVFYSFSSIKTKESLYNQAISKAQVKIVVA